MTTKEGALRYDSSVYVGHDDEFTYEDGDANSFSLLYLAVKRMSDLLVVVPAIVVLFPFMLFIAALVRLTSEGPAVFRQKRVGRDGRLFWTYKFRTMVNGAENLEKFLTPEMVRTYERNRKLPDDPRITWLGLFLRKASLDELPQIFNVLKGDMSIVGPRPMLPEEIGLYGANYRHYIRLRPGITGLWQIRCRYRTTMRDRSRLDLCYCRSASIGLDLWILFKTVGVVLSKKGAC